MSVSSSDPILCVFKPKQMVAHLLSIDNLEPLLHLAALCAPALLVGDQGYVGVFGEAVITCAAVNTLSIVIITQVIIATTEATKTFIYKCPTSLILLFRPANFIL